MIADLLAAAVDGADLGPDDIARLDTAVGPDLDAVCATANALRARQAGDRVTYVVNRNINFTNVCVRSCQFCAFARGFRSEDGYWLSEAEVVARAVEARDLGATEVCLQAGLAPAATGRTYIDLVAAVKRAAPELHVHALSPEEVKFGARLARRSIRDYLAELVDVGLGSLPGTSAEILDDALRDRISPTRISVAEWIDVIRTAHALGLPTTATMMFGHAETAAHRAHHLCLLRGLQRETGGFTEIVPLSFVHDEAPMWRHGTVDGVRPGATREEVLRTYAITRIVLGSTFRNVQASWVKEGLALARDLLDCGVNDLGGTLINESISTAAGASHGQLATPATLRRVARAAGRIPAQRTTDYRILRTFDDPAADPAEALDGVDAARFGSYARLTAEEAHRYPRIEQG